MFNPRKKKYEKIAHFLTFFRNSSLELSKGWTYQQNTSYQLGYLSMYQFRAILALISSTLFLHRESKLGLFLKIHFGDYVIRDDAIGFSDTGKESSLPTQSNGETHSFLPWHRKSAFSLARVSLTKFLVTKEKIGWLVTPIAITLRQTPKSDS